MAAVITTIPIRSCAAATVSFRSTSTCRDARRPPKRCSTACCCCRRRFAAPARSSADGFRAMDETLDKLGEMIAGALPGSVTGHGVAHGELTIGAIAGDIVKVATFLRDDERFQFWIIIDVTAVDWPGGDARVDVSCHFLRTNADP